jgi:hypothetical protein
MCEMPCVPDHSQAMSKTQKTQTQMRVLSPLGPSRPEDQLRRYQVAREQLERRRRARGERFAHLRRMHD